MVGNGLTMEKTTGDKLTKNSQQSDLYNYNLDHVYCSDNSRYRNNAGTTHLNLAAAASDLKSLRKENKQLQAMLLLHLDLIQEQSNQLIAKDKQLIQLREENAQLRLKCERNAANERRQNNNRYTANASGKVLNTSGGSPTIDSYFTTTTTPTTPTTDSRTTNRPHHDNIKHKTLNTITSQNVMINCNSPANENQTMHDIRNSQSAFPQIKVEVNSVKTTDDNTKTHSNVLSDIGQAKDRYKVVTSSGNSNSNSNSSSNMMHDKTIPVKYRAIENSVIGHNNGKLISKIILQRKKSENGEKIFVRTKNIEIGSNNKVNYEKWSPLRTIKSEVMDSDIDKDESIVLDQTASPKSNITAIAINDEEISSDTPDTSNFLAATSMDQSPPSPSMNVTTDQMDITTTECEIENIKIEQDLDDSQEDEPHQSPMAYDPNDTLDDSQDASNMESPHTSESMPIAPMSGSSPITSTVSTSDCNPNELFSGNYLDSNSDMATSGTTILYPISKRHINRGAFLTTKREYKTREWQLDEIEQELKQEITDEICKEENEANLELPKWRTWEMSSNRDAPVPREYEDLSDDAYARRHARFLLDERKRKKWDVQRIREQRTIERLKRRHCKDELNQQNIGNEIYTFFPTVDQLKTIQITDDLPVSAFGEPIPSLSSCEFSLPWQHSSNVATPSTSNIAAANDLAPRIDHHSGTSLMATDFTSRSSSNCSNASVDVPTSNHSSIIFLSKTLSKKRAGRTRASISHN